MDRTIQILLLENFSADAELISKELVTDNTIYAITVVSWLEDFSSALTRFCPDLVLADTDGSAFNCYDQLQILRQTSMIVPFIVLAKASDEEVAIDLVSSGADDYILKDRLGRLSIAIWQALEKRRIEKIAQNTLKELTISESRYRSLIENSSDAVVILDEEGKPTYVSPSVSNVLGYSPQEIMEMDLFSIMHPDDLAATSKVLQTVLATPGVPINGHTGKMLHKNGTWRWIEAVVTNCLHDPAINGIVDNFRDITEKKAAELQLYKSEHFNKSILSSLTSHIAVIDNQGIVIATNKAWDDFDAANETATIDRSPQGSNYFEVCERASSNGVTGAAEALSGIYSVFRKEVNLFEMQCPSHICDAKRWFILRVMNLGDDDSRIVISFENITDLKVAQQELTLSQSRLEFQADLLDTIGQAVIATDLSGSITFWNKAAERIYGWSALEASSKNLMELIPTHVSGGNKRNVKAIIKRGKAWSGELKVQRKDGSSFPIWLTNSPIYNPEHQLIGIIGISTDITERKQTQSALEESERNYSALFHLSPLPMWVFDLKTLVFLDVNQAAQYSYGYSRDEFLSMTIRDIRPLEEIPRLNEALQMKKSTGEKMVSQGIFIHKKKNGQLIQANIQSNLIQYQGKPATIIVASDMTESFAYVHAIEEQNTKLREIAWIQSHVVRAPLARIMGIIPMIKDIDSFVEERETMLEYLLIAAHELDDAIKNISDKTSNTLPRP